MKKWGAVSRWLLTVIEAHGKDSAVDLSATEISLELVSEGCVFDDVLGVIYNSHTPTPTTPLHPLPHPSHPSGVEERTANACTLLSNLDIAMMELVGTSWPLMNLLPMQLAERDAEMAGQFGVVMLGLAMRCGLKDQFITDIMRMETVVKGVLMVVIQETMAWERGPTGDGTELSIANPPSRRASQIESNGANGETMGADEQEERRRNPRQRKWSVVEEYEQMQVECAKLRAENKQMAKDLRIAREDLASVSAQCEDLSQRCAESMEVQVRPGRSLSRDSQQSDGSGGGGAAATKEIEELKAQLEAAERRRQDDREEMVEELVIERRKALQAEEQMEAAVREAGLRERDAKSAMVELQECRDLCKSLEQANEDSVDQILELEQKMQRIEADRQRLMSRKAVEDNLRSELQLAYKDVGERGTQLSLLSEEAKSLRLDKDRAESLLSKLRAEIDDLRQASEARGVGAGADQVDINRRLSMVSVSLQDEVRTLAGGGSLVDGSSNLQSTRQLRLQTARLEEEVGKLLAEKSVLQADLLVSQSRVNALTAEVTAMRPIAADLVTHQLEVYRRRATRHAHVVLDECEDSTHWDRISGDVSGVVLESRKCVNHNETAVMLYRARIEVNKSVAYLIDRLWNLDNRVRWDPIFGPDSQVVNEYDCPDLRVTHAKANLRVPFVDNRDFSLLEHMVLKSDRESGFQVGILCFASISTPAVPIPPPKVVRATAHASGIVVSKLMSSASDRCAVTYLVHVELGGSLPEVVASKFLSHVVTSIACLAQ